MRYLGTLFDAPPVAAGAAGPSDDVTHWFVLLSVGVLVVVVFRWLKLGEGLGDVVATFGSLVTAVVAVVALIVIVFALLVMLGIVTGIGW